MRVARLGRGTLSAALALCGVLGAPCCTAFTSATGSSAGGDAGDAGGGAGSEAGTLTPGECGGRRADCDGERANGCEASLDSDAKNCGACRHDCAAPSNVESAA